MKSLTPYIRIVGFAVLAYAGIRILGSVDGNDPFADLPVLWVLLFVLILVALVAELCVYALENILYRSLKEDAKKKYDEDIAFAKANQFKWFKDFYQKITASKPVEEEGEIVLDHNYDGIRELDNKLPPWWVYGFYATIVFAFIYMARYHIFDGQDQEEEYIEAVAEANIQIEEWKKTAKDLVDVSTVELLTDASDLSAGETIFSANCAACHKIDGGGGIGPNLTDDYWLLGGGIKNIFKTVSEGGRPGKGMVAWKTNLKPSEIAQVASYVVSMHGTTPADPKDPEGEIWVEDGHPVEQISIDVDSTGVEVIMEDEPVTEDIIEGEK